MERIAAAARAILQRAIDTGGTTLRDYRTPGGDPGLFTIELAAYGRAGQPCPRCGGAIRALRSGRPIHLLLPALPAPLILTSACASTRRW